MLKVKDLIEMLQQCDPELTVLEQCEGGYFAPNAIFQGEFYLDCNPNYPEYGGKHIEAKYAKWALNSDVISEKDKEKIRNAEKRTCIYIGEVI